ncbi:MAG: hypothetical protein FJ008_07245 [Chloroflexi bacterium]|nr:hypothetical protein [Chloroflexota bacterium]MBM4450441.1 hypothetical protein [Chloroflexota bacterium]
MSKKLTIKANFRNVILGFTMFGVATVLTLSSASPALAWDQKTFNNSHKKCMESGVKFGMQTAGAYMGSSLGATAGGALGVVAGGGVLAPVGTAAGWVAGRQVGKAVGYVEAAGVCGAYATYKTLRK